MLATGETISGEAGPEAHFPACSQAVAMPAPVTDAR